MTPYVPAGQIATQQTSLAGDLRVLFNNQQAKLTYAGSAPGTVGLYQINVVVPNGSTGGEVNVAVYVNGVLMASATIGLD